MDKDLLKKISKLVFLDFFVFGILYFPTWWYSVGIYRVMLKCYSLVIDSWHNLGISIQLRYLFEPMYGQRDFTGIAISFVMRIFLIIYKFINLIFIFFICIIMFVLWASIPILAVYGIIKNYKFLVLR